MFPITLGAVAPGLLVLAVLFAAYAYGRRREVSELKVLLKDLQDRVGRAPSEEQLDQLGQVILRSQRSFKELIDSFDDVACAVSLDGTFRTVNRRVTRLRALHYREIIGPQAGRILRRRPRATRSKRGLGRFLEKRRWSGIVPVAQEQLTRSFTSIAC